MHKAAEPANDSLALDPVLVKAERSADAVALCIF